MPAGKPSEVKPAGTEMAGNPVFVSTFLTMIELL